MAALNATGDLSKALEEWEAQKSDGDVLPALIKIAELIENETETHYKMDPDPFDDRHPGRAKPSCILGQLLKTLLKNEDFMNKLVSSYLMSNRENTKLNVTAARLLLDLLPGLEVAVAFQNNEALIRHLFTWAEHAAEPLRSYATGLLAAAMELQEVFSNHTEKNFVLVPVMLRRLHELKEKAEKEMTAESIRYFSMFSKSPARSETPDKHADSDISVDGTLLQSESTAIVSSTPKPLHVIDEAEDDKMDTVSSPLAVPLEQPLPASSVIDNEHLCTDIANGSEPLPPDKANCGECLSPDAPSGSQPPISDKASGKEPLPPDKAIGAENLSPDKTSGNEPLPPDKATDKAHLSTDKDSDKEPLHPDDAMGHQPLSSNHISDKDPLSSDPVGTKRPLSTHLRGSKHPLSPDLIDTEHPLSPDLRGTKRPLSPAYASGDPDHVGSKKSKFSKEVFGGTKEISSSSCFELEHYVIGSYCMSPLGVNMQQRLILQYLTPMGEYQELLSTVFEQNAMELIFYYMDLKRNKDVRLAFEALKYLAILLCHKKFAVEFITLGGVQKLISVYRPSVAATGVSLCLYYLSYFEDAMERVCLLPDHVLSELVSYVLWLLECSHESGRCHACMFFSHSFVFRVILQLFDEKDGLRRLFNMISTLDILNFDENTEVPGEDHVFSSRQAARHVCVSLKKYFEAHIVMKANEVSRSHERMENGSPRNDSPAYKAMKLGVEVVQESIELLLEYLPVRSHWPPVFEFLKLGGISLLSQLIAMAPDWNNYSLRGETIRSGLDVIAACTVTPTAQLLLLDGVPIPGNMLTPIISIFVGLAEGEILPDPEVQKSALSVINNCVCGPTERLGGGVARYLGSSTKKRASQKSEDVLCKLWNGVRSNNGIMVLLKLLSFKTPITDADCIRALACKALVGLSRSDTVRQILSKLPLFSNGQLQSLIREPVLQDKRQEHIKFCRYATELINRVAGKKDSRIEDKTLEDIRRADIVAQTRIVYNEKDLLQLIYGHLMNKGLKETASLLQREAELPHQPVATGVVHPTSPHVYSSPTTSRMNRQLSQSSPTTSTNRATLSGASVNTNGPIRINLAHSHTENSPISSHLNRLPCLSQRQQQSKFIRGQSDALNMTSPQVRKSVLKVPGDYHMTLDKLVTEYFRTQHSLCPNPMSTCPPISLFEPHRCPEPRNKNSAPLSIVSRLHRRERQPRFGGSDGARLDRKYVYSRFRPSRVIRNTEEDISFSCCAFDNGDNNVIVGTYAGNCKLYSLKTGEESASVSCHSSVITHCEASRDARLLLTSSLWSQPMSALWKTGEHFDNLYNFDEDNHCVFSQLTQDRILGSKEEKAHVYDVATGKRIATIFDHNKANYYNRNHAAFNYTDDLILNDGVLWDVRSWKAIHKFDKFNPNISGVFHPKRQEIIINCEIWDLRTYKLLRTVPALDQCQVTFNHTGHIIYGTIFQPEDVEAADDKLHQYYGSTFRTFDSLDYSSIATIDVKKNILEIASDNSDCYLAVIEQNQQHDDGLGMSEENVCRLYEVGKLKDEDDDQADEEEDEDEDAGDDEDDDDDDDDDDEDDISNLIHSGDENTDDEQDNQDDGDDDPAPGSEGRESDADGGDDDDEEEEVEDDSDDDGFVFDDDILFELSGS